MLSPRFYPVNLANLTPRAGGWAIHWFLAGAVISSVPTLAQNTKTGDRRGQYRSGNGLGILLPRPFSLNIGYYQLQTTCDEYGPWEERHRSQTRRNGNSIGISCRLAI